MCEADISSDANSSLSEEFNLLVYL